VDSGHAAAGDSSEYMGEPATGQQKAETLTARCKAALRAPLFARG